MNFFQGSIFAKFSLFLSVFNFTFVCGFCPDGWIPVYRSCLLAVVNETTFDDAQIQCLSMDAHVVQFNREIYRMLRIFVDYHEKDFWLSSGKTCSIMTSTPIIVHPGNCKTSYSYICESFADYQIPYCDGSIFYESHCLTSFTRIKESRDNAKHRCAILGGHLFNTATKFRASIARVNAILKNDSFWIGNTTQEDEECMMVTPINMTDASFTWQSGGCKGSTTEAYALCEAPVVSSITTKAPKSTTTTTTTVTTTTLSPSCPEGYNWVSKGDFCYWETSHETEKMSWEKARKFCNEYGGDLASYSDMQEESTALNAASGTFTDLWIGLKREALKKDFRWVDYSPLIYTNWAPGQPDNSSASKLCVAHVGTDSFWTASYCNYRRWFICKVRKVGSPKSYKPSQDQMPLCDDDGTWFRYGNNCYQITHWQKFSWYMAKMFCMDNGAHLASVHSENETEFILDLSQKASYSYADAAWVGLNAQGFRSSFAWSDGTSLDYIRWDEHPNINNVSASECVVFSIHTGFWSIEHCNNMLSVICKKGVNVTLTFTTPATTPVMPGYCPDDWYTLGNKCFKNFGIKASEKLTWSNARDKCTSIGATLAIVHSQKEQDLMTQLVLDSGYSAWVGLNASMRGILFHWLDDSPIDYTNWNMGEPSQYGRQEDCVEMVYDETSMGRWNDVFCDSAKSYICQKLKDSTLQSPGRDPSMCAEPWGWSKLTTSCYKAFYGTEKNMSWLAAQSFCRQHKANLVGIADGAVSSFLTNLLPSENKTWYWIGVKESGPNMYRNFLQYQVSYSNWLTFQPTRVSKTGENCVAMNQDGLWMVRNCKENHPFICQYSNDHSEHGLEELQQGNCPSNNLDWKNVKGRNCYLIKTDENISWRTAIQRCFHLGGSLASFHSHEELDILAPYLKHAEMPVYIGLGKTHDGGLSWIDGTAVDFVNWQVGEPSSPSELCIEMHSDVMTWNDVSCYVERGYICTVAKNFTGSKENPEKSSSQPVSEGHLNVESILGIFACVLVVLGIVVAALYYRRRVTKPSSRRFSDCDTPLQECAASRSQECE